MSGTGPARVSDAHTIKIRLKSVQQLFNSLDPSPFIEKDLDADAEQFIESWAAETPRGNALRLVLHLETPPGDASECESIGVAIRNFFEYRADATRRELTRLWIVGRYSMLIGLLFVAVCMGAAQAVGRLWNDSTAAEILEQSLVIVGWVAMWRPLEIFLYDWWPIAQRVRLYRRLSEMEVEFAKPE